MSTDYILSRLDLQQIASTFLVLFAIIDILGSTPIFISLKQRGKAINALKATFLSTTLLVGFFYAGDATLKLFSVDIQSFAVAGALIILIIALEMLLDVEIFKYGGPSNEATLIPVVFPLIAGAGAFTTLLSLKAEYATVNIMIGLGLNMIFVYIVISAADKIQRFVSENVIYVLRKFFGVILLAIAVKLFTSNLLPLINNL